MSFEAAARLGSFTRAANELNVTQSAVSQQIRALERHLGSRLFQRSHKSVRLLPEGVEFQQSVSAALAHLAGASRRVAAPGVDRVTIAADQSFIAMWLMPRLSRLLAAWPDTDFRIVASDRRDDSFAEAVDLAVVHGEGQWPGYECRHFFGDEIFPVCAPTYAQDHPELCAVGGLSSAFLLDLEYEQWNWMNWSIWLTEANAAVYDGGRRLLMNSYPLVIEAARDGLGVGLGWRHLVDADLNTGRLVRPMPEIVTTHSSYWLTRRTNSGRNGVGDQVCEWLLAERDEHVLFDGQG